MELNITFVDDSATHILTFPMKLTMIVMYSIIAILAFIGNIGVCFVVKNQRTVFQTIRVKHANRENNKFITNGENNENKKSLLTEKSVYNIDNGGTTNNSLRSSPLITPKNKLECEIPRKTYKNGNANLKLAMHQKPAITNLFIFYLSCADILMALLCIPFSFVADQILGYWPFGPIMCPVVSYAQAVSVMISAYIMVLISIDRYNVIMFPLRPKMTHRQANWAIACIYIFALLIPLPIAILSRLALEEAPIVPVELQTPNISLNKYNHSQNRVYYKCVESWSSHVSKKIFSVSLLLLQYAFPLMILTFTYFSICKKIWGNETPGEAHVIRDEKIVKSKIKVNSN
ncbi:unnamed protein product [Gordionus sp. m RMFG-2023]